MAKVEKIRLDALLVDQGWAESREQAKRLIMAGVVWSEGQRLDKPGVKIPADTPLEVQRDPCPYVSRGGLKLEGALDALSVDPSGLVCADIGASTGGFTDCLLQRGAVRVYAIDVGRNQLHERMRSDPRVVSLEKVNARQITAETIPEQAALATIDVSFISLGLVLPALREILISQARVLALVKPQFEAGPEHVKGGVVRDPATHRDVLTRVGSIAAQLGWVRLGACPSPLLGPAGNREFFILWGIDPNTPKPPERDWVGPLVEPLDAT